VAFLAGCIILFVVGGFIDFTKGVMMVYSSVMLALEVGLIMLHMRKDKIRSALDCVLVEWIAESLVDSHGVRRSSQPSSRHVTDESESQQLREPQQEQPQEQRQQEPKQEQLRQQPEQQRPPLQQQQPQQQQVAEGKWSVSGSGTEAVQEWKARRLPEKERWEMRQAESKPTVWHQPGTLANSSVRQSSSEEEEQAKQMNEVD
jgi:hypothetical protein